MKILLLIVFLQMAYLVSAQDEEKPIRWMFAVSAGTSVPLTSTSAPLIISSFIPYKNPAFNFRTSGTWFFGKLGLVAELAVSANNTGAKNQRLFTHDTNEKYGDQYYITGSTYFAGSQSVIVNANAGVAYKIEKKKFVFIGRAMIGITSFDLDNYNLTLKEKGTNNLLRVNWSTPNVSSDNFTFHPSVAVGYKLGRHFLLTAHIDYSIFRPGFTYTETTTNINTGDNTYQPYNYHKTFQELSVGIGCAFVLRRPIKS